VENTIHLTVLLAEHRADILKRWMRRIRREHADKELSRGELADQVPAV
jgi:ribosome-binding protein aMBF1 (putative translation factor)